MFSSVIALTLLLALSATTHATGISVTPHTQFSSSIGVLGCKINTDRAAYWPSFPSCDNVCVRVTHPSGRSLTLLHIDQSGGAYDISYDAYNYLVTGNNLIPGPAIMGGGVDMDYEDVDMWDPECMALLTKEGSGKLAFSAPNAMGFVTGCMVNEPGSWVANNFALYNIANPTCTLGIDEKCAFDAGMLAAGLNQPSCPSPLGMQPKLTSAPVFDYLYGTNVAVVAP